MPNKALIELLIELHSAMSTSSVPDDLEPPSFSRSTWAEIDLHALRCNVRELCRIAGNGAPLLAVVKANAYGHGAVPVAHALVGSGVGSGDAEPESRVRMLGVASVDEGIHLREAGIEAPILLLSAILPGEAHAAVRAGLVPTVFTREVAAAVNEAGAMMGRTAPMHVKIDTGMNRLGVWHCEAPAFYRSLAAFPHLRVTGIYTHFACADEPDDTMTAEQMRAFEAALRECGVWPRRLAGLPPQEMVIHASNSAALLRYPAAAYDMVRPGIALYCASPPQCVEGKAISLRPVMTLKARITRVATVPSGAPVSYGATWRAAGSARIATVSVGYADGYPRRLSNRAAVLIRDTRCPVVGRVTMDQILVDCTRLAPDIRIGEVVTLFGQGLPVEEIAAWAETISYEILCGVAHRVPRVYIDATDIE